VTSDRLIELNGTVWTKSVDEIIVEIDSKINGWINEAISKKGNSLMKSVVKSLPKPLIKSMDTHQSFPKIEIPKEEIFK
jgi:hypothetical protein